METKEKLAIAAALRAYFVSVGLIDSHTDSQCKSWLAHVEPYVQSESQGMVEFGYAVVCELTVYTNCCCNVEFKEFDGDCGDWPYEEQQSFTLLHWSQDEAEELAEWLTNGEGVNHWILSKDKE